MQPKEKGQQTEAIILAELIKRKYVVLSPFGDNERYDYVIEKRGSNIFSRIQCKTGRYNNGIIEFDTVSTRINSKQYIKSNYKNQIDSFVVYCYELDTLYNVPVDIAPDSSHMKLRVDEPKNGQKTKINWAKDFQI